MKKLKSTIIVLALLALPFVTLASDPPDPGGNPQSEPPLGGGAPIGRGLFVLLGLGAIYGARKVYIMKKEDLEK